MRNVKVERTVAAPRGPLAFIFGPMLDRQMIKGFNGFIDSLEPAAQARATA
jgi:hypothetical protein